MLATQIRRISGGRILSLAMLGGLTFGTGVVHANPAMPQAPVAPVAARYTWVNFDGQWLCRSWSNATPAVKVIVPHLATSGATIWDFDPVGGRAFGMTGDRARQTTTRCTTHWHIDGAIRLLSDDAIWAPNPRGEWPLASDLLAVEQPARVRVTQPRSLVTVKAHQSPVRVSQPRTTTSGSTGGSTSASTGGSTSGTGGTAPSGGYNPWTPVPGHPTYGMSDFAGDPNASSFGVCTWYAWYRHQNEPLTQLGHAGEWAWNAPKYGLAVGTTPRVGATVVFQPGVEGAGGTGHVGHVEAVLGGGWFIISEMNFYWNGGGWGRVDYRYAYVRSGVSFIY